MIWSPNWSFASQLMHFDEKKYRNVLNFIHPKSLDSGRRCLSLLDYYISNSFQNNSWYVQLHACTALNFQLSHLPVHASQPNVSSWCSWLFIKIEPFPFEFSTCTQLSLFITSFKACHFTFKTTSVGNFEKFIFSCPEIVLTHCLLVKSTNPLA